MKAYLSITKSLADETRVRALLALRDGELCVCQLIDLLGLSPSTVSKHMSILQQAGLVSRRKDGRWHYYRMAGEEATPAVRAAIDWTLKSLANEQIIVADAAELCSVREKDLTDLTVCYTAGKG